MAFETCRVRIRRLYSLVTDCSVSTLSYCIELLPQLWNTIVLSTAAEIQEILSYRALLYLTKQKVG